MGELEAVPRKADPLERGIEKVSEGTNAFGAMREDGPHRGTDFFVAKNTPVQVPAGTAVLIGVTRHSRTGAGYSMGNALVFFIPDPVNPHFLALLHLSPRTFRQLKESDIGAVLRSGPGEGRIVAYTGDSATERVGAHLHVTAVTTFMYGVKVYTADDFMRRQREGTLGEFLEGKNFRSIVPRSGLRNRRSMEDYLDPMELIRNGQIRISSVPLPERVERTRTVMLR